VCVWGGGGVSDDKNSAGYRYIRGYISIRVEMCVCVYCVYMFDDANFMQITGYAMVWWWRRHRGEVVRCWSPPHAAPQEKDLLKINRKNKIKDMDASVTPSQRTVTAQPVDL
jgi:hypothetical protein